MKIEYIRELLTNMLEHQVSHNNIRIRYASDANDHFNHMSHSLICSNEQKKRSNTLFAHELKYATTEQLHDDFHAHWVSIAFHNIFHGKIFIRIIVK